MRATFASLFLFCLAMPVSADTVVSIDFGSAGNVFTGVGAVTSIGPTTFNNLQLSNGAGGAVQTGFTDQNGNLSGLSVTVSGSLAQSGTGAGNARFGTTTQVIQTGSVNEPADTAAAALTNALFRDYVFDNDNGALTSDNRQLDVSLANLDPTATYDLYIYTGPLFRPRLTSTVTATFNGVTETVNYQAQAAFQEGVNFALFDGITGVSSINGTLTSLGPFGVVDATIAGIQLVEVAAVPEPSGITLLGLIGIAVMSRRKRI